MENDLDLKEARIKIEALEEEGRSLIYRPQYVPITGSVTSSILLSQILFRSKRQKTNKGTSVFYKFITPPAIGVNHPQYTSIGDSWTEELGFSKREFTYALKYIGYRIPGVRGKVDEQAKEKALIWYWKDMNDAMWWDVNYEGFARKISEVKKANNSPKQ